MDFFHQKGRKAGHPVVPDEPEKNRLAISDQFSVKRTEDCQIYLTPIIY